MRPNTREALVKQPPVEHEIHRRLRRLDAHRPEDPVPERLRRQERPIHGRAIAVARDELEGRVPIGCLAEEEMRLDLLSGRELDVHLQGGARIDAAVDAAGEAPALESRGSRVVATPAQELRPVRGEPVDLELRGFTLEEGAEQLLAAAEALELPLREAVKGGLVELVYLSRPAVRAIQLLSLLGDKVRARKARRVVLDSVTHLARDAAPSAELWHMLYKLVQSLKTLDATSVLTLETTSLHSSDEATESGFSPLADNILVLRYAITPKGELRPVLTVVKTRGSVHDSGTHGLRVGPGGLRIVDAGRGRPPARRGG